MSTRRRRPLLAVAAALVSAAAAADEVYLKGGGQLSGKIVTRTATTIQVDVGAGTIGVPVSSVLRVEEKRSPLHEFEERAGALAAGDVPGWLTLGDWAKAKGLSTQVREAYNRALAASPTDPRANAALGNVELDGRWVSEDDAMKARGYVQHQGEWISPAEAEARAREAEAAAAASRQQLEGLPLWYGWGAGPVYWPSGPVIAPPVTPSRPITRPRPQPR